jgi:hypothetical protein
VPPAESTGTVCAEMNPRAADSVGPRGRHPRTLSPEPAEDESGGGGKPPTAAVSQVAPIARQYRNLATELLSEVAMRATSSMAACASFIALVVELVAVATASMFSAI